MGKYIVNGNRFESDKDLRAACQNDTNFRISSYGHNEKVPPIRLIELLDAMGFQTEVIDHTPDEKK